MKDNIGIILIDGFEVLIRVYQSIGGGWKQLRSQNRDLSLFQRGKELKSSEVIEVIAEVSLSGYSLGVSDWRIIVRDLSDETIHNIQLATGLKINNLTLVREQELICKGILSEIKF